MTEGTAEFSVSNSDKLPQIDQSYGAGRGYNPINELMRAMILRVVDDLNSEGELRAEALEYLFSDDEEYILSFQAICRHLGFDPAKTRDKILNPGHKISTRRRAA